MSEKDNQQVGKVIGRGGRAFKWCVSLAILVFGGAIVADNLYLHREVTRLENEIMVARESDVFVKELKGLKTEVSELRDGLGEFAKIEVENDKQVLGTLGKLENWVETCSVQGKWNGYKRQLGDWESRMAERYRKLKDSARRKYEELKKGGE